MPRTWGNFIAGEWVEASTGKTFEDRNPAHRDEVVAAFQASGSEDVRRAVAAAAAAFPRWRDTPAPERAESLRRAANVMRRRLEEAAETLTREEGKTLREARGEVERSIMLLEFYAGQGKLLTGETFPSDGPGTFLYTMRAPLGVVALVTPWNFPSGIPVWKAAPAMLCGNTVVLKPSSLAPCSGAIVAEALAEAGLPDGVFNMVTGAGGAVGDALVDDARVRAISFTGSREVGRSIMAKAAPRLVRVGLEMGGKNPVVVMDDADLDEAAKIVAVGAFWSAGHKCTATSRAIVLDRVHDEFVEKLVERASSLRVGDGMDPETEICPVIDEAQLEAILGHIEAGKSEGARLLTGGERLSGGVYDDGWYVSPAVFGGVEPGMRIAQEEIFGPVVSVIKVKDFDEAIEVANGIEYGLSAAISTKSLAASMEFARRIDVGLVHVNSPTAGVEIQIPFGGMKDSTSGYREMGKLAFDFYSQWKTVYVDA